MSKAQINASGHLVNVADDAAVLDTAVLNEAGGVIVGSVLVMEAAGTVKLYDASSEADCSGIVGVANGTYANGATVSYFTDGDEITGLTGHTPGTQLWAAPATGTLVPYGSVGSSDWTRPMGTSTSATTVQLQIGDVIQKP